MAVNILNSTTVTPALSSTDNEFAVGSTTNISVGYLLAVRGEFMHVRAIPVSGRVVVRRGYQGTRAVAHPAGVKAWIGSPESFKAIASTQLAIVGSSGTYPDYLLPGSRASDSAGNEYILVEMARTAFAGETLCISRDGAFTADTLQGGVSQGNVGVLVENSTSDQFAWLQIYGYYASAQEGEGTSDATSTYGAFAETSLSTPACGLMAVVTPNSNAAESYPIHGMFIVGAASTATTSSSDTHSGISVPVWLNYPYVNFYKEVQVTTS